jgi:DNA-binding CsgD family transcriptional regulator
MEQPVSKFSVEFRDAIVRVIKDDHFFLNNAATTLQPALLYEKYKSLIDSINGFIVICNYATGLYEYVSGGIYSNLGYDFSKSSNEEMTDFVTSIIKEDHREFLLYSLLPKVLKYLQQHSNSHVGTDYRYSCCLQVRNVYNAYLWYLIDTVLIEVDANGMPLRTLITCTNIDHIKRDDCIYYNITKKNDDGVYQVMLEGTSDNRINDLKLTAREIEIINLISRGNTNQEVADKLFISLHTVQTHRKNIMKKTKCSGTAELTNFAFARGLL